MSDQCFDKFGVSFPPDLSKAMARHIGRKSRSGYLQSLVEADLRAKGAYNPDPITAEIERTRELIAARGLDVVRAKHDEIVQESLTSAGSS